MPFTFDEIAIGGVAIGGSANQSILSRNFATGGIICGSSAFEYRTIVKNSSGGAVAGKTSLVKVVFTNYSANGGVVASGSSAPKIVIVASGGITSGGSAIHSIGFSSKGGLKASGQARQTFIDYVNATGGIKAGGLGREAHKKFYRFSTSGGVVTSGSSDYGISNRSVETLGVIDIAGTARSNFKFNLDLNFLWNTSSRIQTDITLLWNTGRLFNYWYRIIGTDNCHDPCCQRYIMNIHARSLTELCDKLATRRHKLKIESAERFIIPAINSEALIFKEEGYNIDDCNVFVPVPLCKIPRCEEFCIDFDLTVDFDFDIIRTPTNAFFVYESSGEAFITGSADISYQRFVPNFPHQSVGGINVSGAANVNGSGYSYTPQEDYVYVSGSASLKSSNWRFVGGQWPNTTRQRIAEKTGSLLYQTNDQNWSLTDRVIVDDGLFASTDISYARKSEFLIVSGFDFTIPDDSVILHIYVNVQRKSNQVGTRDLNAYVVLDGEIISSNMAKTTTDWPYLMESQTTYDFTESFNVDDLNNNSIGFALRVGCINSLASTIAYVDFVTIEVIYESELNQRIRMGGSAKIVSCNFSWNAFGGVEIDGTSNVRSGFKYKTNGNYVTISGDYALLHVYEANGECVVSGNSDCRPSFQQIESIGGANVGGYADVKPYFEKGTGGTSVSGSSLVSVKTNKTSSGGIVVGGSYISTADAFGVSGSGGFVITGTAKVTTNNWSYRPDGNVVLMFGEANCSASDLGTIYQNYEFDMSIDNILVQFDNSADLQNAKGLTDLLSRCGCGDIPLSLNLEHNFARDNNFAKFLNRNNFTISNRMKMQYNTTNDSWQANLHYKGISSDSNTEETWDIVFDVQCTQNLGSIFIGSQIWKLSMEVARKNLFTGDKFDTRIVVGVLPDQICAANELKFKTTINTQTDLTEITPSATIYQSILYDDVGLFKSLSWKTNPILIFTVSQVGLDKPQKRVDLTTQVLIS